ncbi:MAG: zinc-dependent alcohol dehydrogenase family protein [Myxococcota bacterium]
MKAWEIGEGFGVEHLRRVERPEPEPGPHQVVVGVRAVSLNYRDLMMVRGSYDPKQPLPLVPCSDGAGEVVAVGSDVTRVRVGDRVAGLFAQRWIDGEPTREKLRSTLGGPRDGMLAEKVTLHEEGLVHVPEHLSDEEAATLPCAAVTAWNALTIHGGVTAGDAVLVQGTGGVSLFALQLARLVGARVIATSSRDDKLARAEALGAEAGINYRADPGWGKRARELTGGRGVDLVVEVGGADTLAQSLRAVRPGGTIAVIGVLSGVKTSLALTHVLMNVVRLQGIMVGSRASFESMNRAIAAHRMRPVVDHVYDFAEAPRAFEHLASGTQFGKLCIRMGS